MVDEPLPIPTKVVLLALPLMLQFLITLFVAPSPAAVCSHTTALDVPVFVLMMVRSLDAVAGGQILLVV